MSGGPDEAETGLAERLALFTASEANGMDAEAVLRCLIVVQTMVIASSLPPDEWTAIAETSAETLRRNVEAMRRRRGAH